MTVIEMATTAAIYVRVSSEEQGDLAGAGLGERYLGELARLLVADFETPADGDEECDGWRP